MSPAAAVRERLPYFGLAAALVVFDQLTKWIIVAHVPLYDRVHVVPRFFDITHVQNVGAAFGLFAGATSAYRPILLNAVAFLVFAGVLVYAFRSPVHWRSLQTGLACIMGGAVGNLIDRLRTGSVTDFLRFYVGRHEWPSFNVADSAITIGVALLAWDLWKNPDKDPEDAADAA